MAIFERSHNSQDQKGWEPLV